MKISDLTPIQKIDNIYFKRDDLFVVNGASGGKVRTCYHLAKMANGVGMVTAGSRKSPQINILAKVASHLGIKSYAHCPSGTLSDVLIEAQQYGIEITQHKYGYNSVIIKRAKDFAQENNLVYLPFGMECEEAVNQTKIQTKNIPKYIKRIIVPVGSGMSLAGILHGLNEMNIDILVIGIIVGADPIKRLDTYAPNNWKSKVMLYKSNINYDREIKDNIFHGINLDPIYEAKCIPYINDGDLFWIIGNRKNIT